jgi:DNA mismatch repair protein MutS2
MAILEALTERGVLTIVTTHQGALKSFAHKTTGMANGSMAFDSRTLAPTYRFVAHLPGSSYALEIASRMGLPDPIITRSRSFVGRQVHRLEDLISELQDQLRQNEQLEVDLSQQKRILEQLTKRYEDENARLRHEASDMRQKAAEEANAIIRRANATVEEAIRTIKERSASREAIHEAKALVEGEKELLREELEALTVDQEYDDDQLVGEVEAGESVYWKRGGVVATVVSCEETTDQVMIASGGLKLRVPRIELTKPKPSPKTDVIASSRVDIPYPRNVPREIDIRGMKVEEAVEAVDRFVNDALLAGLNEVQIIHGLGTGALRNSVIPFLETHPLVGQTYAGGPRRDNLGVTVVKIDSK